VLPTPGYPQAAPFSIPSYSDSRWFVPAPPVPGSAEWLTNWKEIYAYGTTDPSASLKTIETDNTAQFSNWFFKYYYRNGRNIVKFPPALEKVSIIEILLSLPLCPPLKHLNTPLVTLPELLHQGFRRRFPPGGSFQTISYSSPSLGFRVFNSFNDFYQEVQNSRMYGGVHWRAALNEGRNLAQKVTDYIWTNSLTRKRNSGGFDDDDE
jgi:hypothetical protein